MTEETTTTEPTGTSEDTQEEPQTFDAEYVRKLRAEAAKYRSDAKAAKDAVDELAKIRDAQKTDADRAADALKEAQQAAAEARAETARFKIALEHHLTADDAALLEGVTDEESMQRIAKRLAAADSGKTRAPRPDPNQGGAVKGSASTAEQFAAFASSQL